MNIDECRMKIIEMLLKMEASDIRFLNQIFILIQRHLERTGRL